jgi:hypothetical protein
MLIAVANGWYDPGDGVARMVTEGELVTPGAPADEQCPTVFEPV